MKNNKKNVFSTQQQALLVQLNDMMSIDRRRLFARIKGMNQLKHPTNINKVIVEIEQQIQQAQVRFLQRQSAVQKMEFPQNLPVNQKKLKSRNLFGNTK